VSPTRRAARPVHSREEGTSALVPETMRPFGHWLVPRPRGAIRWTARCGVEAGAFAALEAALRLAVYPTPRCVAGGGHAARPGSG
jgi:hypothetical protein